MEAAQSHICFFYSRSPEVSFPPLHPSYPDPLLLTYRCHICCKTCLHYEICAHASLLWSIHPTSSTPTPQFGHCLSVICSCKFDSALKLWLTTLVLICRHRHTLKVRINKEQPERHMASVWYWAHNFRTLISGTLALVCISGLCLCCQPLSTPHQCTHLCR